MICKQSLPNQSPHPPWLITTTHTLLSTSTDSTQLIGTPPPSNKANLRWQQYVGEAFHNITTRECPLRGAATAWSVRVRSTFQISPLCPSVTGSNTVMHFSADKLCTSSTRDDGVLSWGRLRSVRLTFWTEMNQFELILSNLSCFSIWQNIIDDSCQIWQLSAKCEKQKRMCQASITGSKWITCITIIIKCIQGETVQNNNNTTLTLMLMLSKQSGLFAAAAVCMTGSGEKWPVAVDKVVMFWNLLLRVY